MDRRSERMKRNVLSKIGSVIFDALQENEIVQGIIMGSAASLVIIGVILAAHAAR